jgi:glycogen synthase
VMCVSAGLRDSLIKKGLQLENARVVYNGIDVNQFSPERGLLSPLEKRENLRLLVAGQIARHKGVHTAIEAMNQLVHEDEIKNVQLTIVGTGHPDYLAHLRQLMIRKKLDGFVEFRDWIPRDEMPALLRDFGVLLLTSIYDEPMARIAQEAMASGLVLIGTRTGGTSEFLRDGENGLAFTPGEPQDLAAQIRIIFRDRELAKRLRVAGMKTIDKCFNIERTVDDIETYLFTLADQSKWPLKGGPNS